VAACIEGGALLDRLGQHSEHRRPKLVPPAGGLFDALGASGQGEGLPMSKPEGYGEQNGARYWQRPRIPG
jgi:hypothetical protein